MKNKSIKKETLEKMMTIMIIMIIHKIITLFKQKKTKQTQTMITFHPIIIMKKLNQTLWNLEILFKLMNIKKEIII